LRMRERVGQIEEEREKTVKKIERCVFVCVCVFEREREMEKVSERVRRGERDRE